MNSSRRRPKRDNITIHGDDSLNDHPAVKNKKKETESIISPEVVSELQKKIIELEQANAKLEKNFQGSCRIAGEAQARVQFLENLVDTKPNIVDGANSKEREDELEKKVSQLAAQLEQERVDRVIERTRNDDLERKLCHLERWAEEVQLIPGYSGPPKPQFPSQEFDVIPGLPVPSEPQFPSEPIETHAMPADTEPEVVYDGAKKKKRVDELEENIDYLVNQLEEEGGNIPNNTTHLPRNSQIPSCIPPKIHDNAHPTNILALCRPDAPETLSLDSAMKQMDDAMDNYGRDIFHKKLGRRCKAANLEDLECEVCRKTVANINVIHHFLSKPHVKKVRSRGAAVSLAAYKHWLRLLLPTSAAPAAPLRGGK